MAAPKQRRLDSAVAAIQQRYGSQSLRPARELATQPRHPHISSGFPALDAITGCGGMPLDAAVLLSGRMTSGKLTLAYKTLVEAQNLATKPTPGAPAVAILDLARTTNPDYLQRCGIALDNLLLARPESGRAAVNLLVDLVRSRSLRAILVDSLVEMAAESRDMRYLAAHLGKLERLLDHSGCLVLWIDEPQPFWSRLLNWDRGAALRPRVALHLTLQQEAWFQAGAGLAGYQAQVRVLKSRWAQNTRSAAIRIVFNGSVRSQTTW